MLLFTVVSVYNCDFENKLFLFLFLSLKKWPFATDNILLCCSNFEPDEYITIHVVPRKYFSGIFCNSEVFSP